MKSISAIYKIGKGPSSSHTMGPEKASAIFLAEHPEAEAFRVTLYGSLSKTGRGHGTDTVIREVLGKHRTEIVWDNDTSELPHPNTMLLEALNKGTVIAQMRAMSIGGGDISIEGRPDITLPEVYRESHFSEIAALCKSRNIRLCDYVLENEGEENESGMRSGPQMRQPESDSIEASRRNTRPPFGISGKSSSMPMGSVVTS